MNHQILVAAATPQERLALCGALGAHFSDRCAILEAENTEEALALFIQHCPQAAVLDIDMEDMGGLELARQIRQNGDGCMLLFLSAHENFEYARAAIDLHAAGYLLKPWDKRELIRCAERALVLYDRLRGGTAPAAEEHPKDPEENPPAQRLSQIRGRLEHYIREHYASELSMQDAARAMNYSDAYFCKLFKQCFGVNFSAYLNDYRIALAGQMLLSTRLSVREVAQACGYTDANYFTRIFKRATGRTPSEYRIE
jgi:YesN/AraC family two-component response regulator